jgi:hypothetical protein
MPWELAWDRGHNSTDVVGGGADLAIHVALEKGMEPAAHYSHVA